MAASVAVHAILLALVWVQAPRLTAPAPASAPPEAIIPVLLIPRAPPPAAAPAGATPTPIRLHRRRQPFSAEPPPIAPLIAPVQPAAPAPKAAPSPQIRPTIGPRADDALVQNARRALRSQLDCDSPTLTRAEREACVERFGQRGRDQPFQGLGVDRDKARALEAAARRKAEDYVYKRSAPGGVGVSGSGYNAGAIKQPDKPSTGIGATSEDLGRATGNDARRELKVPF
ncbi:MAG: hypothetical protein JNK30_11905 [Phenylobacterium sp.]|nr:hypothetical protein [Phenylobacterium sp.]